MTGILERKAGAGAVDPDDFNAAVDAVVTLGGAVTTRKAGAAAVDPDDFNAVIDATVTLGGTIRDRKAGAGNVDTDDFNALIDSIYTLQNPPGGGTWTQAETVTMPTNYNLGDGVIYIAGVGLFSNTFTSTGKLIKWANPATDLATYSTLTFTGSGTGKSVGLAYSSVTGFLYQCFDVYDDGTNYKVKVAKIDPSNLTWSILIDDILTDDSGVPQGQCSITVNDTHLFLATHTSRSSGPDAEVRKYLLTDGSYVGQRTVTGHRHIHPFAYDSVTGKLYGGGSDASAIWAFSMPTDLSTHTVAQLAAAGTANDDIVFRDAYFWLSDEGSTDRVFRVKKSDLTFDTVAITCSGKCDGLYNDTSRILLAISDDGTSTSEVQSIDPDALTATAGYVTTGSNVAKVNEVLLLDSNTMIVATYEATSKVARFTRS